MQIIKEKISMNELKKMVHLFFVGIILLTGNVVFSMNPEDIHKIGMLIWQNEASQRTDLLVFWNERESFPSLGIGHCIWYPEGYDGPYTQQFPLLCDYFQKHGVILPAWLETAKHTGAPWKSRDEFLQDEKRRQELRDLLTTTVSLQAHFMIERLEHQWPLIVEATSHEHKERVISRYELMKSSPLGVYALVDYLNFKGSGLNPREESKGLHWGLQQVLLNMPDEVIHDNVTKAFAISAAKILLQLIENSAPDYRRIKFLHGWMKRLSTYTDAALLNTI